MATLIRPPLLRLKDALQAMREATANPELQAQIMQTFLYIVTRHPNQVPMKEVEDLALTVLFRMSRAYAGDTV